MGFAERFNFYDFFAYGVPGAAAIGTGLAVASSMGVGTVEGGLWKAGGFVLASYLLGMYIQEIGRKVVPSKTIDGPTSASDMRYPSDALLDAGELGAGPYAKLSHTLRRRLRLDLTKSDDRLLAFKYCRSILQSEGGLGYSEQFQGLQAASRGLAVVAAIVAGQGLGFAANHALRVLVGWWGCEAFGDAFYPLMDVSLRTASVACVLCFGVMLHADREWEGIPEWLARMLASLMSALGLVPACEARVGALLVSGGLVGGLISSARVVADWADLWSAVAVGVVGLGACKAMIAAHKRFARDFVLSIYQNFVVHVSKAKP